MSPVAAVLLVVGMSVATTMLLLAYLSVSKAVSREVVMTDLLRREAEGVLVSREGDRCLVVSPVREVVRVGESYCVGSTCVYCSNISIVVIRAIPVAGERG